MKNPPQRFKPVRAFSAAGRVPKTPPQTQVNQFRLRFTPIICAAIAGCLALSGQAANILVNPGFEASPGFSGWTATSTESWSMGPSTALVHGGANSLWMQGLYGNGGAPDPYTESASQTIACAPGSIFSADAWFSQYVHDSAAEGGDNGSGSGLFTSDGSGQEDGWVEVMFLDASSVILADYKSKILDPAFVQNDTNLATNGTGNIYLAWIDCQVTNQYDPTTLVLNADPDNDSAGITNTLKSGQYMVAPPATKYVRFRLASSQNLYESGASYWDDCSLNQVGGPSPAVVADFAPDGTKFFNIAATNLTFNVASASAGGAALPTIPTNGITITVNGVNKSGSLQFSGTSTNWNVTLPNLASNQTYNITVTVSNSSGLISSASDIFDTFGANNFIVTVEDYDFSNGLYIQNPIPTAKPATNSYFGTAGAFGVDDSTYLPTGTLPAGSSQTVNGLAIRTDNNVAFQQATDVQLPIYLAQNNPNVFNVNLSYNNAGNWENYTRVYPSGNYLVYARISGGTGAVGYEYLNLLTGGYGTANPTTNNLGVFILPSTYNYNSWNNYMWVPLTDASGNLITVSLPAGRQTLQLFSGGGQNVIDFMFVPLSGGGLPPVINNFNPPVGVIGSNVFLTITNLAFSVSSAFGTIATNNVHTLLNGVDVSSSATFSGVNTNWNVRVPVPQNEILTLVINATDNNGLSNSVTETFDTFSQNNYMWEAEDYDFNGGQFIDNPIPSADSTVIVGGAGAGSEATNSYYLAPAETGTTLSGIDASAAVVGGETFYYRNPDIVGTQPATDFLRQKFIAAQALLGDSGICDYNVAYFNGGDWLNYTRHYPAGTYYIYGRLAGGAGPFSGSFLSIVTSGWGTMTQSTNVLGYFADPNAAAWQTYHWVPMLDTNNHLLPIKFTGGTNTLKFTSGGNLNPNYFMLLPVPAPPTAVTLSISRSGSQISISFASLAGHTYTVQYANSLSKATTWSTLIVIAGDGTVKTATDTISGSQRFYQVVAQ